MSATSAAFSVVVLDAIGDTCNHLDEGKRLTRMGVAEIARRNMLIDVDCYEELAYACLKPSVIFYILHASHKRAPNDAVVGYMTSGTISVQYFSG